MSVTRTGEGVFASYIKELRRPEYDVLNDEEEYALRVQLAEEQDEDARQELVKRNLRLVLTEAKKRIALGAPAHLLPELVQQGNVGLVHASYKYSHSRVKFISFALYWILRMMGEVDWREPPFYVPYQMRVDARRISRTAVSLHQKTGRSPTPKEIAQASGDPIKRVSRALLLNRHTVSLQKELRKEGRVTFEECTELHHVPDGELLCIARDEYRRARSTLDEMLAVIMRSLTEKQGVVFTLRHGLHDESLERMTFSDIGERLSITRQGASAHYTKALRRLKKKEIPLEEFNAHLDTLQKLHEFVV